MDLNKIRDIVRQEVKKEERKTQEINYIIGSQTASAVTNAATSTSWPDNLTAKITQSISDQGRVGDAINLLHLSLRGYVATGSSVNTIRILVVSTTQIVGNALNTFFYYAGGGNVLMPFSPLQNDTAPLYHVWWDRFYTVNTYNPTKAFHAEITLSGDWAKVQYQFGGTSSVNNLNIVCVSDDANVPNPTITYAWKLTYLD